MTKMEFGKDHYLELLQISVLRCVLAGLIWTKPVGHCTFLWSFVVIFAELQLLESQAVTWFLGRCYISRTTTPRIPGSYMVFGQVVLTGWFWNQPVIIESIKIRTIYVEYIRSNICFIKNIIGVFFSLKDRHKTAVVCFENLKASQLEEILFIIPLRRWTQLVALGHHKQMHARETTILETSFISQLGSRCFSPWCAAPWTVTVLTGSGLPLCPVWYKVNEQRFLKARLVIQNLLCRCTLRLSRRRTALTTPPQHVWPWSPWEGDTVGLLFHSTGGPGDIGTDRCSGKPDPSSPTTLRVNYAFVIITFNGIQRKLLCKRLQTATLHRFLRFFPTFKSYDACIIRWIHLSRHWTQFSCFFFSSVTC